MSRNIILALAGCTGPDPEPPVVLPDGEIAVLAATDYAVGALAAVSVADREVYDTLATVSADPVVIADGGVLVQINRYGVDTVRLYTPGDFSAPDVEFSTGSGSNPLSAAFCGDDLFVSEYGTPGLGVYDRTGARIGSVDLSEFADDDGSPEPAEIARIGDRLYVAMNRLATRADWLPAGPGVVAEIACGSREILRSWEVGPNPSVHLVPGEAPRIAIRTGIYYEPDRETLELDGDLRILDPETGEFSGVLLVESEIGENITALAATDERIVAITQDQESIYTVRCLDFEGGVEIAGDSTAFLQAIAINSRGEAWIAAAPSWADPLAPTGVLIYDPVGCAPITEAPIETLLPPASIAFYER